MICHLLCFCFFYCDIVERDVVVKFRVMDQLVIGDYWYVLGICFLDDHCCGFLVDGCDDEYFCVFGQFCFGL